MTVFDRAHPVVSFPLSANTTHHLRGVSSLRSKRTGYVSEVTHNPLFGSRACPRHTFAPPEQACNTVVQGWYYASKHGQARQAHAAGRNKPQHRAAPRGHFTKGPKGRARPRWRLINTRKTLSTPPHTQHRPQIHRHTDTQTQAELLTTTRRDETTHHGSGELPIAKDESFERPKAGGREERIPHRACGGREGEHLVGV